jgi:hypothetical protein
MTTPSSNVNPSRRIRIHLSTIVLTLILLVPLALIIVPGTKTFWTDDGAEYRRHGWPVVFLDRAAWDEQYIEAIVRGHEIWAGGKGVSEGRKAEILTAILLESKRTLNELQTRQRAESRFDDERQLITLDPSFQPDWQDPQAWPVKSLAVKFRLWGMFMDVCFVLAYAAICATILEFRRRRRKSVFQISIGEILFVAVPIVGFSMLVLTARSSQLADHETKKQIARIINLKLENRSSFTPAVLFEDSIIGSRWLRPVWLRKLIGSNWEQSFVQCTRFSFCPPHYENKAKRVWEIDFAEINRLTSSMKHMQVLEVKPWEELPLVDQFEVSRRVNEVHLRIEVDWHDVSGVSLANCKRLNCVAFIEEAGVDHRANRVQYVSNVLSTRRVRDIRLVSWEAITDDELAAISKLNCGSVSYDRCEFASK